MFLWDTFVELPRVRVKDRKSHDFTIKIKRRNASITTKFVFSIIRTLMASRASLKKSQKMNIKTNVEGKPTCKNTIRWVRSRLEKKFEKKKIDKIRLINVKLFLTFSK